MSQQKLNTSIAIIGVGDVGAAIAYALLLNPVAHDIILVDLNDELLEAQVADLGDATYRGNSGVRVKKGDFKEAGQADIVVVTAGAKQKKGESSGPVRDGRGCSGGAHCLGLTSVLHLKIVTTLKLARAI